MGQAHLLVESPKAQAEESYGPSPITVLEYSRGQFSPRQIQNPTGKKG